MNDQEESKIPVNPWTVLGAVAVLIVAVWAGTHYYFGCSDFFNACVVGKK